MPKNNKLDAERNAAKLPDSKFDAKELKKGTDREMEHTKSRAEAEKIAKQHLFDNPKYYSKLDKAGFEELELEEKWSEKYKKSIDCNNPKGFSQRAHCQGRKKMSETIDEGKNKPTNPALWSRAKSAARSKFKVYPSAYANAWASKWYKKHGGGWRKAGKKKKANESIELHILDDSLLLECSCGCGECQVMHDDVMDMEPYYDFEDSEYMDDIFNSMKGDPDLNDDGMYDSMELYSHFDLDDDGTVIPDEYESHVNYHARHPEILSMKKQIRPVVQAIYEQLGGLTSTTTQPAATPTINTTVVAPEIDKKIQQIAKEPGTIKLVTNLQVKPAELNKLKNMFNLPHDQLLSLYDGNKETLKKAAKILLLSLNPIEIMKLKDEYNSAKSSGGLAEAARDPRLGKMGFKTYMAMNLLRAVLELASDEEDGNTGEQDAKITMSDKNSISGGKPKP